MQMNASEAKNRLSHLIKSAQAGYEVAIAMQRFLRAKHPSMHVPESHA